MYVPIGQEVGIALTFAALATLQERQSLLASCREALEQMSTEQGTDEQQLLDRHLAACQGYQQKVENLKEKADDDFNDLRRRCSSYIDVKPWVYFA